MNVTARDPPRQERAERHLVDPQLTNPRSSATDPAGGPPADTRSRTPPLLSVAWQTCSSEDSSTRPPTRRAGSPVTLDTADFLTTHGVIVGMTGSGKTGLGVVLIEEGSPPASPRSLIDPKGDMRNLALIFPTCAPADFRPWVNEARPNARRPVDEFAARRPTCGGGPRGWRPRPDRVGCVRAGRVTIYTPGSTSGVPLNIIGRCRAPAARRRGGGARRGRGAAARASSAWSASRRTRSRAASTSCSRTWSSAPGPRGEPLDLATLIGQIPSTRRYASSASSRSTRSSRRTTARRSRSRLNALVASPRSPPGRGRAARRRTSTLRQPDGTAAPR